MARMVTIDDDITNRAVDLIQRQIRANKSFFVSVNTTHMHLPTHTNQRALANRGDGRARTTTR